MDDEYVASFIGLAPSDDPQLVCLVVVDAPQGWPHYGGTVAAPAAREILNDSLRYLGIPLRPTDDKKLLVKEEPVVVPDVVNLSPAEAVASLNSRGFKVQVEGTGNMVWQQIPRAESKFKCGTVVRISLAEYGSSQTDGGITVPDLQGKSMKEVARVLSKLGLNMVPEGYGLSWGQSPAAGQVIGSGSNVTVSFQPLSQ